jgi:hypothetical protein
VPLAIASVAVRSSPATYGKAIVVRINKKPEPFLIRVFHFSHHA